MATYVIAAKFDERERRTALRYVREHDLDPVVALCWAAGLDVDRYASAAEVVEALRRVGRATAGEYKTLVTSAGRLQKTHERQLPLDLSDAYGLPRPKARRRSAWEIAQAQA